MKIVPVRPQINLEELSYGDVLIPLNGSEEWIISVNNNGLRTLSRDRVGQKVDDLIVKRYQYNRNEGSLSSPSSQLVYRGDSQDENEKKQYEEWDNLLRELEKKKIVH